jgi:hypothetical protein
LASRSTASGKLGVILVACETPELPLGLGYEG